MKWSIKKIGFQVEHGTVYLTFFTAQSLCCVQDGVWCSILWYDMNDVMMYDSKDRHSQCLSLMGATAL